MDKDTLYRLRHPEKVKETHKKYYATHKAVINARNRTYYNQNKDCILQSQKLDRSTCPLCNLSFRRGYLAKHIETRHNKV